MDQEQQQRLRHTRRCTLAGDRSAAELNFLAASKSYDEAIAHSMSMGVVRAMEPSIKLGVCLCELARYAEAERVLTQCLDRAGDGGGDCEEGGDGGVDGIDGVLRVRALTALASLYRAQSRYDAAIRLHERAIPMARNLAQDTSQPSSLVARVQTQQSRSRSLVLADNLAGYAETLRKSGRLSQAEAYHREALDIRSDAVEQSACTELELAVSYTQLGCTLAGQQKHEDSYQMHHRALTLRYRLVEFSHGLVSESLNYCAESLCALGRGAEGIPLAMHAASIRKKVFGTNHPAYAHALSVLAVCHHSVNRLGDARDYIERCLKICEVSLPKNHANVIPNLMRYGMILRSLGDLEKARTEYQRAITIHELNFKEGTEAGQLEECMMQVTELADMIDTKTSIPASVNLESSLTEITSADIESRGTPVIVFTDIGRDVDDEMALVLISALRNQRLLNPIAVVTTLCPQKDRASLARGSLDSLCMADVPVGIGGRGGVADGVELEVYDAEHACCSPSIHESGIGLACRALESVPDGSAQILCLASMSDVASLIREHQQLFTTKVKEVVIMGGVMPLDSSPTLVPDTAYNNNCDMDAANYIYERCQELRVPTATLSRWAAYGCPVRPRLLDELAKTRHMVAANIRGRSRGSLDALWNKVVLPVDHPRREKLPARCNVKWFYSTFCGTDEIPDELPASIWGQVEKLNMYDPLAALICVPAYRSKHFDCKAKVVDGVSHIVVGTSESETGIKDCNYLELYKEYSHLFIEALQASMHEPEMPTGSEKAPDMLIEETTKIWNHRSRAA